MFGSIIGDIIGSVFEFDEMKDPNFDLFSDRSVFTDDSVLTIATADTILHGGDYATNYRTIGRQHPNVGWGTGFRRWLHSNDMGPYNSFGNGSAMRVSPVGFAYDDIDTVLAEAKRSAEVSHNHPEGIRGAQATALAILLARKGSSKDMIRQMIQDKFGYDLTRTCSGIRPVYSFDETCQKTVPEAIIAFLDSTSFEDAIRQAVSLGGDADTLGCITGGIAQAFYKKIPEEIVSVCMSTLPKQFVVTIEEFNNKFNIKL